MNLELHVIPILGTRNPSDLTPDDLDDLTELLREKGLNNKSIVYVHATFRKALNYAMRRRQLQMNVYDLYDLPRVECFYYPIMDDDLFAHMLDLADGEAPLSLAIRLALRYGLRRGEVLGLRRSDLSGNVLHIQRTRTVEGRADSVTPCKTRSSNRYILLMPEDATAIAAVKGDYVVSLTPTQLNKGFLTFLRRGGFPAMRFHDLRHNYATYMYRHGVDVKTISTVLGHSSVKITMDIYAHPDLQVQNACLQALP